MYISLTKNISKVTASVVTVVCLFLLTSRLAAQDIHYSQFYNSPLNISPALTGIFNGDERFTASLRDQWRTVPVPWFTLSGSYDKKFYPKNSDKGFFSGGVLFNYDKQGDSNLALININLTASYTFVFNKKNLLSFGGMAGFANRGFDPEGLTWDKQWINNAFDPTAISGESFDFESYSFLETALGLNYRWQKTERTHFDIGIGGFHITTPESRFYNGIDESLPLRLSLYGIATMQLNDDMDLQLDILHQRQRQYRELVFGGYVNFYLNQQRGKETQLRVGAGYRTTKGLFPKVGFEYRNWLVAFSYDMDFSEFSDFNHENGPEIHLRYIIKHVKPLGKFKICPVF